MSLLAASDGLGWPDAVGPPGVLRVLWGRRVDPTMSAENPEVPTFSECVVGYRQWRVDAWQQLQPTSGHTNHGGWIPGENVAQCAYNCVAGEEELAKWVGIAPGFRHRPLLEPHAPPHKDCQCGLYARFDLATCDDRHQSDIYPLVGGAIAAWGDLEVHRDGFRAQRACVIALALTGEKKLDGLIEGIADFYEVPAVHKDMLEHEALLYGSHLPEDVIPVKQTEKELEDIILSRQRRHYHLHNPNMSSKDYVSMYFEAAETRKKKRTRLFGR
jgi:hypothetical protein